ncbi:hypothetical protein EIP91_002488 [Steccherinum ochraceum]|uniref:J domain-containing protein n=1 Tax=Steccherinum ochraceum TaxID=92696 RepID=A0A4R0RNW7_9APHY|nr:hypothetical protein EIP91_002488 [Steccherinum ochraceum]
MASLVGSVLGWSYIPNFATQLLLPYFHRGYQSFTGRQPPPRNTPQYHKHYRYVYAFVVTSYLLYNFRDAAMSTTPNYYEILNVDPTSDEATLKSAFRQFAKKNHPDRVGIQGEALFMEVRDAFEALKNPVTRFAYDRFGPQALTWKNCSSIREYVRHGLMQSAGYHIVTVCALLLYSAVGKPSPISFWRFLLFAALFTYELVFLLSPSPSPASNTDLSAFLFTDPASPSHNSILGLLWPNRVAYQHIRFLHALFMLCTVAVSRVAPVLFPMPQDVDSKMLLNEFNKLNGLAQAADAEASSMIQIEMHSIHGTDASFPQVPAIERPSDEVMSLLTHEMENMVIESKLRKEADAGPLATTLKMAVERKKRSEETLEQRRLMNGSPMKMSWTVLRSPSTPSRSGTARPMGSPLPTTRVQEGYIRARSQSC